MSDDHTSVPGAAGSISVNPKASIRLTPAQDYTRLVGAFVVGAAVGVGAALALAALSGEEPPIRVRPGSIDLGLPSNHKWQEKTDASGQKYWQIINSVKTATEYHSCHHHDRSRSVRQRPRTLDADLPAPRVRRRILGSPGLRANALESRQRTRARFCFPRTSAF